MNYDPDNIFAKILRNEIPCDRLYEDEYALAFNDISPQAPIHALVIPKGQYLSFADFSANARADEIAGFFRVAQRVADDLGLPKDGFRVISNIGRNGHQEVMHFHLHLLGGCDLGSMLKRGLG